ncbi:NAD(P)H-dependent flavin oxidoreductase [Sulfoacidibacillus thermotolerans]|uniref:Probable nitronate monooxygenase n=1 Tax=Sulfoacidibacillus thermotolerans TaxID=1765684 RepID=A0A2U3DC91_SULT2|nr:nitronate monooxygenase [Sulfoacidibacillus thermotolerans]PWI58904.1 2-nitropropane dioxygenase [Sulfoacidibacillus thermotolerans]
MENEVCRILGCQVPIIEGGLAYVGNGMLAGAISAAGAFGQVGTAGRSIAQVREQIEEAKKRADGRPFGINLPLSEHRDMSEYVHLITEYAPVLRAISLSAGNPRPLIPHFQQLGLKVMVVVSTPEQAVKAEQAGADLLVAEGYEAGGHNGPAELTTFTLIPQVVRAVSIPVVAAGGIVNGTGIAAALLLGAKGVQLGTRFVATQECEAHENYKRELLLRKSADTTIIERSMGRVTRVLKSPFVEQILEIEATHPTWETLAPYVSGTKNKTAAILGQMDEGWVNCGQGVGMIEELPTAADLIEELVTQTKEHLARAQTLF